MALTPGGNINVRVSAEDMELLGAALIDHPKLMRQAIRAAINDTARSGATALSRRMKESMNLTYGDIRSRITQELGKGDELQAGIRLDYQAVPMRKFAPKYKRGMGVTVTQIRDRGAQLFAWMFAGRIPNAPTKKMIYAREIGAAKYAPKHGRYANRKLTRGPRKGQLMLRQPLRQTFGPSVLKVFEVTPKIQDDTYSGLADTLHKRILSKLDWMLDRIAKMSK